MNYKDINDKWKSFLFENTFKEDKLVKPGKEKKKHLKDKSKKKHKEDGKEIITNEFEEYQEEEMDEIAAPDGGSPGPVGYSDTVEEEQLEEMSAMSGGPGVSSAEGYAGGSGGSFMSKKAFKRKWS